MAMTMAELEHGFEKLRAIREIENIMYRHAPHRLPEGLVQTG